MPSQKQEQTKTEKTDENLAVIRIRGEANIDVRTLDALKNLRLLKPHACVIVQKTSSMMGLIRKVKDYIAWGEIDSATLKLLQEKRGERDPKEPKRLKPFFRLSPPRKGFERKGIKKPFTQGGALGYRGEKINELLMRMI